MTDGTHNQALRVSDIFFTEELPEYPNSSENGTAYIVDVSRKDAHERGVVEDGVSDLDALRTC